MNAPAPADEGGLEGVIIPPAEIYRKVNTLTNEVRDLISEQRTTREVEIERRNAEMLRREAEQRAADAENARRAAWETKVDTRLSALEVRVWTAAGATGAISGIGGYLLGRLFTGH